MLAALHREHEETNRFLRPTSQQPQSPHLDSGALLLVDRRTLLLLNSRALLLEHCLVADLAFLKEWHIQQLICWKILTLSLRHPNVALKIQVTKSARELGLIDLDFMYVFYPLPMGCWAKLWNICLLVPVLWADGTPCKLVYLCKPAHWLWSTGARWLSCTAARSSSSTDSRTPAMRNQGYNLCPTPLCNLPSRKLSSTALFFLSSLFSVSRDIRASTGSLSS